MVSHGVTLCIACGKVLTGRQSKYCSRRCKSKYVAHAVIQKRRGRTRKQQLVELLGGRCEQCGYKENLAALSFHHQERASKSFSLDVRNIRAKPLKLLIAEAKKCTLLCLNCHACLHYGY